MKKSLKDYAAIGLMLFLVVCAVLVFYDTVFASKTLVLLVKKLWSILMPIIYGCAIAYLLLPLVNTFDASIRHRFARADGSVKHPWLVRAGSLTITWLLVAAVTYVMLSIILPQVVDSVSQLASNIETYYNKIYSWGEHLLDSNQKLETWVLNTFNTYYKDLQTWVTTKAMPQASQLVTAVGGGIMNMVSFATDFFIGIIVSIYLLYSKEHWNAGARRLSAALFPEKRQALIRRAVHKIDRIFSGYIRGKLLDSLIIGILCLIACLILKIPYAPLVSLIVGVTNIIPFFGPILGAVPSGLLILLASPLKCLTFVIMIIILQQFDGNILGPKILGDSTGLSSFWVIVAILIGGGFGGISGMFFGVPIFTCFYCLIGALLRHRLHKRQLPTEIDSYGDTPDPGVAPPVPAPKDPGSV